MIALLLFLGGPPAADGLATVPGAVSHMTATQLCSPSFHTASIRPPASETDKLKFRLMDEAGIPRSEAPRYELDHLISLEIGGAPDDPNNLWLEPYFGPRNAHEKDRLENALHEVVCEGRVSLEQAQHDISTDWVAAYRKYVGEIK